MTACLNHINDILALRDKKRDSEKDLVFLDLLVFEIFSSERFCLLSPLAPSILSAKIFNIEVKKAAILLKPWMKRW